MVTFSIETGFLAGKYVSDNRNLNSSSIYTAGIVISGIIILSIFGFFQILIY